MAKCTFCFSLFVVHIISYIFSKTDITGDKELEGAKLTVLDKDGKVIDTWVSTKDTHKIEGLTAGNTYTLREEIAPYGYEVAESIEFTVSFDKETQHIEMKDMPILKSVQVEKVDKATGEHIKSNKFEFGIFEDEECTKLIKKAGANENEGTALFDELRYGTYYIKEIKAPLGYKLSDQVVKIELNDEGVFSDGVSLEKKILYIVLFTTIHYSQQFKLVMKQIII